MKTFEVLRKNKDGGEKHQVSWYYKKWYQPIRPLIDNIIEDTEDGFSVFSIKRID